MRIDLHTHSNRSDGTDTPAELVRNAAEVAHLDVVALTDHDATTGWDEAQAEADRVGVRLVRGIEISTRFQGESVHLLGYEFDPEHPNGWARWGRWVGRHPLIAAAAGILVLLVLAIPVTQIQPGAGRGAAAGSRRA